MRAVVVSGPGQLQVTDRAEPAAGDHALVAVHAGGICGTDLKVFRGEVPAKIPVILGHEVIGKIAVAAPASVMHAGTRVVVDPSVSCGRCAVCRRDLPQLCPDGGLMGRDSDGGFTELIAVPAGRLHPVPEDMPVTDAVMLQVLSTCVHAQTLIRPQLGETAVVVGLGVSGLLHVSLLRASGIRSIVGVSRSETRRALALELGAAAVTPPAGALALVADMTGGAGTDIAIDCAGQAETLTQAMSAAGAGGRVLIFGTVTPSADGMPTYDWYRKELTLVNTRAARPRDFSTAIAVVRDGLISPGRLMTASYPIEEAAAAVAAASSPDETKVMLTMTG